MDLHKTVQLCRHLARQAGSAILRLYQDETMIRSKDDGSPLTLADEAANRVILDGLATEFPRVPVLSEESADDGSRLGAEWCFLVDPLDGTKEFLSRNGEFTVNIALIRVGRPVVGVVFAPALDHLYWAAEGQGAWRISKSQEPERIHVVPSFSPPRLTVSRSHRSSEEDQFIAQRGVVEVVPMGSSLKGCLVASGATDLYLRAGDVMEWDIAAMHAVVAEAGGVVNRWAVRHESVRYNQSESVRVHGFYCAAQGGLL